MDQKRIAAIAAEFYSFLVGENDKIADNPSRWHEKLESWSVSETTMVVAALINKAVNETLEDAAKCVEECRVLVDDLPPVDMARDAAKQLAAQIRAQKTFPP